MHACVYVCSILISLQNNLKAHCIPGGSATETFSIPGDNLHIVPWYMIDRILTPDCRFRCRCLLGFRTSHIYSFTMSPISDSERTYFSVPALTSFPLFRLMMIRNKGIITMYIDQVSVTFSHLVFTCNINTPSSVRKGE